MNWFAISNTGATVIFNDKGIVFRPNEAKTNSGLKENPRVRLRSDKYFETGTITFKVNFGEDTETTFSVNLGNGGIIAGANSIYAKSRCFSIRSKINGEIVLLSQAGDKENLLKNRDYNIKIEVLGSNVVLYVDNILICEATSQIQNAQVQFTYTGKSELIINDFEIKVRKPKAFVVMQFSEDFNDLYQEVIKPVCEDFGYECKRGDEYFTNGSILQDIIQSIQESSVIIADITPNNPNVFYELGYAHAINKPTILLSDKKRDKLPFDISGFRTLFYDNTIAGKSAVERKLKEHLQNIN
jgi:hypothetical protein